MSQGGIIHYKVYEESTAFGAPLSSALSAQGQRGSPEGNRHYPLVAAGQYRQRVVNLRYINSQLCMN